MRICHVITRLIVGGAQENTVSTCVGLRKLGHDVDLVIGPQTGPEGSLCDQAKAAGVPIIVVEELRRRDERDTSRPVAPLKHYPDAIFLDTTGIPVEEAVHRVLVLWREKSQGAPNPPRRG